MQTPFKHRTSLSFSPGRGELQTPHSTSPQHTTTPPPQTSLPSHREGTLFTIHQSTIATNNNRGGGQSPSVTTSQCPAGNANDSRKIQHDSHVTLSGVTGPGDERYEAYLLSPPRNAHLCPFNFVSFCPPTSISLYLHLVAINLSINLSNCSPVFFSVYGKGRNQGAPT